MNISKYTIKNKSKRRVIVSVLIVYYLITVLLHKWAGIFITGIFENFSRSAYQSAMIIAALIIFAVYLYWLIRNSMLLRSAYLIVFTVGLIVLTGLSYPLLIIHYAEAIHFPQYAILAYLFFLINRNYCKVLFWGLILAFIDESYQYFYIDPTNYFDFNDIVLDLLGMVYGLLPFSAGVGKQIELRKNSLLLFTPEIVSLILIIAGLLFLSSFNILSVYPDENSLISLIRNTDDGFWTEIKHLNVAYHIIKPLEGVIILALFYFVFCCLLTFLNETNESK